MDLNSKDSGSCGVPPRKRPRPKQEEGQQLYHHPQQHAEEARANSSNNSKPVAPSLQMFIAPGGPSLYRPRPEWLRIPTSSRLTSNSSNSKNTCDQADSDESPAFTFGRNRETALIVAIRENSTEAALSLIDACAETSISLDPDIPHQSKTLGLLEMENANGTSPLMFAAQKGNSAVLLALLDAGADPAATSENGRSALLQAAHFGNADCCLILLQRGGRALTEVANANSTTPLMRAAQEGHFETVKLLLKYASRHQVNRQNSSQMTALMLAAQRGHAEVCQLLLNNTTQALVDLKTDQGSTAL